MTSTKPVPKNKKVGSKTKTQKVHNLNKKIEKIINLHDFPGLKSGKATETVEFKGGTAVHRHRRRERQRRRLGHGGRGGGVGSHQAQLMVVVLACVGVEQER